MNCLPVCVNSASIYAGIHLYRYMGVFVDTYNVQTFSLHSKYFYKNLNGLTILVSCFCIPTIVFCSMDHFVVVLKNPQIVFIEVP